LERLAQEESEKKGTKFSINKVEFSWEADDRVSYTIKGEQKTTYGFLVVLIALYFIWVGQPLISLAVSAVFFVIYILYTVPASRVTHSIESAGIRSGGQLYLWEDMKSFWIAEKDARMVLYIETRLNFPSRLIFFIDSFNDAERIVTLLLDQIPYIVLQKKQGYFEKMFDGEYVDATTFVKPLTVQELVQIQEKIEKEKEKETASVNKVKSQKNVRIPKSRTA